jgi:GNAT superfamily N-acetyltransferase
MVKSGKQMVLNGLYAEYGPRPVPPEIEMQHGAPLVPQSINLWGVTTVADLYIPAAKEAQLVVKERDFVTRVSLPKTDTHIEGWFDSQTKTLNVNMVWVEEAMRGQGWGTALYSRLLQQFPETRTVIGRPAFDNLKILESTADIMQTPWAKILTKQGFTEHSFDGTFMRSSKP